MSLCIAFPNDGCGGIELGGDHPTCIISGFGCVVSLDPILVLAIPAPFLALITAATAAAVDGVEVGSRRGRKDRRLALKDPAGRGAHELGDLDQALGDLDARLSGANGDGQG